MAQTERPAPSIGVDIGGSKVLAVRLGPSGEVEAVAKRPTPSLKVDVVSLVLALAGELSAPGGTGGPDGLGMMEAGAAIGLGVGCPGMVDGAGTAHFCPHLHDLDGFALGDALARRRPPGVPTVVLNDASAACWAEYCLGAGRGATDVLMVTMGTGIGGGAVVGGRLLRGAHGFAGEIGHMVVDPGGPPCPCGKRGCWERYASGSALGWLGQRAAGVGASALSGEAVVASARTGNPEALAAVGELAGWLALGLANLANLLDPEVIVLGGGVVEAGEVVFGPVRRAFEDAVEGPAARGVRIVPAHFGERAGAVGAALMARDGSAVDQAVRPPGL